MAEKDSAQEPTEEPTAKRLEKARNDGNVPRSKDLEIASVTGFSALFLFLMGPELFAQLREFFQKSFVLGPKEVRDSSSVLTRLGDSLIDLLTFIVPLGLVTVFVALVVPALMGGFIFSAKNIAPKPSKLNPLKGLKRIFGIKGLVELLKSVLKITLIAGLFLLIFYYRRDQLLSLSGYAPDLAIAKAMNVLGWAFITLIIALLVIAAVDAPYQLWNYHKELKMTKQEVRDEHKDTDGKPELKARQRQIRQELAFSRVMEAVPKADVVITNPTHYAVALRYDQNKMRAPIVVAKGRDLVAAKIREVATEHRITLVSAPLVARALHASTKVDQAIPEGLYIAVAEILAFVFKLKKMRWQPGTRPKAPNPDVPEEILTRYHVDRSGIDER